MTDRENILVRKYEKYRELLAPYVSEELLAFIDDSDFRTAPASTRQEYHGCWRGGLLEHSLGVLTYLRMFNQMFKSPYTAEQITRAALLHDVCKIGCYHEEQKWRKDEHGKWESYIGWTFDDDFPAGHGSKSVAVILSYGTMLSKDEIMAITHHMGAYNLSGAALQDYQRAVKVCPLALLLHWADMSNAHVEPQMLARKEEEVQRVARQKPEEAE